MVDIRALIDEALADFQQVGILAGAEIAADKITIEIRGKPHRAPTSLPIGRMAVYAFFLDGKALKIGKAGRKTSARYTSQHYNPASAKSTLARSILANPNKVHATGVDAQSAGDWIKRHTDRANLLVPASFGLPLLSLLEAFLHVRWNPMFEGRAESD
jgi:hypothetical protein